MGVDVHSEHVFIVESPESWRARLALNVQSKKELIAVNKDFARGVSYQAYAYYAKEGTRNRIAQTSFVKVGTA